METLLLYGAIFMFFVYVIVLGCGIVWFIYMMYTAGRD